MAWLFREHTATRVAGIFDESEAARSVVVDILNDSGMDIEQVRVVHPDDPAVDRKLEEGTGIGRPGAIALDVVGMLAGLLFAAALMLAGVDFATSRPLLTLFLSTGAGAYLGMIFGWQLTSKSVAGEMISKVREASNRGLWAVVVLPANHDQEAHARKVISQSHGQLLLN